MRGLQVRAYSFGLLRLPTRVRRARPRTAAAQWLMLLVALAGLFAMHGLSDHGVGGPVAMSSAMSSGMSSAMSSEMSSGMASTTSTVADSARHTGHARHVGQDAGTSGSSSHAAHGDTLVTGGGPGATRGTGGGGHGDHDGMLAGMCLAVMAAVLALGLAAWRSRALAYLRNVFGDLNRVALTTWRSRSWGPAPPDLNRLSIQRC